MKRLVYIFVSGLMAVPAFAQTQGEKMDADTVQYFVDHPAERKDIIAKCDANPDQTKNDSNCILAKKADSQAGVNDVKGGVDSVIQGAADFFHKF